MCLLKKKPFKSGSAIRWSVSFEILGLDKRSSSNLILAIFPAPQTSTLQKKKKKNLKTPESCRALCSIITGCIPT